MKAFRVFLFIAMLSCFLPPCARAQDEKQSAVARSALALEITHGQGALPTYQPVPNVYWYGRFRELQGWTPAPGALPVQAVNIATSVEGAAVRVVVSVHLGKKFFEKQEKVGSYLLQENERLKVYEMMAFGLEPFELTAVRVEKKRAYIPAVISDAPSVEVREVQALEATFPTFNLKLRNASAKNVTALSIEIRVGGRTRISAIAHNRDAVPLINAGGTYEYKRQFVSSATQVNGGYIPETLPNQSLIIKAALFDDGTFEGDAGFAVRYRAFALGARTQLARLEESYRQALQSTESGTQAALDNLLRQVNALNTEVDVRAFEKLLADFSVSAVDRPRLEEGVEVIMFETKKEAVKAIEEFRQKQSPANDTGALRAWLIASRDKYQKWHERLRKL